MKRRYFENVRIDIDKTHIEITSGGTPYIIKNGTYRKLDHLNMHNCLMVTLPGKGEYKIFRDKEGKIQYEYQNK